ncbi:restriction endonuclease subunit S [Geodermatophilus sp. SYSU D00710]
MTRPVWEQVGLGDAVEFLDSRRRPVKVGDRAKMRGSVPYYGASGIVDHVNRYLFDEDLILLGEDGENILSRVVPLAFKISGKSWVNNHAHVLRPRRGFDIDFLAEYLESLDYADLNTGTAQPKLNKRSCLRIGVAKPPLREQRQIAKALGDVDELIALLERLIDKKQAIKQGMMQQLLTGRARLPTFNGRWQFSRLGDVLTVRHGRNQRAVEVPSGRYPILATGGQIGWTNTPLYSKPSVLIGRKGTIDRPQFQDRPFWTVDTLFYTDISPTADPRFLYYIFLTVDWRSMNEASGVPSLSSTRIEGVEVKLPGIAEQIAIRDVLDDVDREIALLHERLRKARDLKTGMMQQLLTGRTRLPVEAVS